MDALGLHLNRRGVRAVIVGDDGGVRASVAVEGPEIAAAAQEAVRQAVEEHEFGAAAVASNGYDDADFDKVVSVLRGDPRLAKMTVVAAGAAAVTAEEWIGAAKGARHAICLWIGEDVLAGILLDGRPWSGAHGLAGAAAWLALNPVERQDYRKFGSLAAEVSDKGIARRLAWRIQAGDSSAVLERAGDLDAITATHVFEGARSGDGVSVSVVRDTAKYIGMAVSNLAAAIDPEVVVISGPVSAAGDLLIEPVRQECARRLPPAIAEQFRCEISPLGVNGVAIGAARLAGSR
jgi:predicted NBD/HSP70 family sugar kinase